MALHDRKLETPFCRLRNFSSWQKVNNRGLEFVVLCLPFTPLLVVDSKDYASQLQQRKAAPHESLLQLLRKRETAEAKADFRWQEGSGLISTHDLSSMEFFVIGLIEWRG